MGEFGGRMHGDAILNIAADCIDLEESLLALGDSGECKLDFLIADLASNANGILVAADADLFARGKCHPSAEYQQGDSKRESED
jgi:hypothetical protein